MKRVGILFHPKVQRAESFAHTIEDFLNGESIKCWLHSSWDEAEAKKCVGGSDLIISVGGDGTILRVARIIFPEEVPIVGVNFGNLGFMAELEAEEALSKLPAILAGGGWIEKRAMLQAEISSSGKIYNALNDVVVARGRFIRLVNIEVTIDGEAFTTYRADAVMVSTATGSTGYALAANGPILTPESREMILKAVCPHVSMDKALILMPDTRIELKVLTNHEAIISMDGQVESQLQNGEKISVLLSPHVSRFIRLQPRTKFFNTIATKLRGKSI